MLLQYLWKLRRNKWNFLMSVMLVSGVIYLTGVHEYMFTVDFESQFAYPLNVDIKPLVEEVLAGKKPSVTPINYYPYRFLSNSGVCDTVDKIDLFLIIKSAMLNFGHRNAIRQTYTKDSVPGKVVKYLFFIGTNDPKDEVQKEINYEMEQHKDIIQIDFIDNYYNNTIKTMSSFRWLYEHCASVEFYFFTDDDMYISVKNIFRYIEGRPKTKNLASVDEDLYAGYVFRSRPLRVAWSKWRVPLEEYPWSWWPPYVTAMAYLVSNKSMKNIYVGSLFVKHFRFDDIYLSIVAYKVGITPTHCRQFYFYKKRYNKLDYKYVIASHGFGDHDELMRVWKDQNDDRNGDLFW